MIIAGAGKAAHLPGMCAALFPMPVIGIPMKRLIWRRGLPLFHCPDALRHPGGHGCHQRRKERRDPAAKILAASDPELLSRLKAYSEKMKNEVVGKAEKLDKTGYKEYLASMKK